MRKGTCRNFTGTMQKVCEAGVNYRDHVGGDDFGWCCRIPCVKGHDKAGQIVVPCAKYEEPSPEEIATHEASIKRFVTRMEKALPLIAKVKKEHSGEDWVGVEVCPICGGKLYMTHAGTVNGHVWGKCETEGCVSWIE